MPQSTSRSLQRLAHEAELIMFEVAQPAVDQLGRFRRGAFGKVVCFEQQHARPAPGGIARDAGAVNAAADDDDIIGLHAFRASVQSLWQRCRICQGADIVCGLRMRVAFASRIRPILAMLSKGTIVSVKVETLVLFGATGDLAQRMLFPRSTISTSTALLADALTIIGSGRSKMDRAAFQAAGPRCAGRASARRPDRGRRRRRLPGSHRLLCDRCRRGHGL